MTRYVVRIKVDKKPRNIHHRREVVTTKTKEEVCAYFRDLYSNHEKNGSNVDISIMYTFECGDLFEILYK